MCFPTKTSLEVNVAPTITPYIRFRFDCHRSYMPPYWLH